MFPRNFYEISTKFLDHPRSGGGESSELSHTEISIFVVPLNGTDMTFKRYFRSKHWKFANQPRIEISRERHKERGGWIGMYTYTYIHIYEFESLQQFASLAEIGLISICDNSKITIAVPRSRYSVQNLFVIKNERGKKEGKEGRNFHRSFLDGKMWY